jgi:hypothetical protein
LATIATAAWLAAGQVDSPSKPLRILFAIVAIWHVLAISLAAYDSARHISKGDLLEAAAGFAAIIAFVPVTVSTGMLAAGLTWHAFWPTFLLYLYAGVMTGWAFYLIGLLLSGLIPTRAWSGRVPGILLLGLGLAAGAGVALTTEGTRLALMVESGSSVEPVRLAGLPLLDVAAVSVRVEWVLPEGQRPTSLFDQRLHICGLLLGQSATTAFVIVQPAADYAIARLPVASVSITQADGCLA